MLQFLRFNLGTGKKKKVTRGQCCTRTGCENLSSHRSPKFDNAIAYLIPLFSEQKAGGAGDFLGSGRN